MCSTTDNIYWSNSMQQTKRTSGVFVRNISQQFGGIAPDKSTCKCDSKDLDRLKEVHLVSSRRQLFEENADVQEQFSKNYYRNQNGNSDAKRKSDLTNKTEVNYDIHVVTPQRRSLRTSYKERRSNALDDHPQDDDDHNNNVVLYEAQNEQDKAEKRRSYVIKNNIDDFNEKKVDKCESTEDDNEMMQNCEEPVNKMISDETRKSLDSLTLSLHFMQSLLGIQNKPQGNTTSQDIDDKPEKIGKYYKFKSTSRLSTEFKTKDDNGKEIRGSSYFTRDSDSTTNEGKGIVECSCKNLDDEEKKTGTAFDANEEESATITDSIKRKPRLSRFTRLSLKKQKYTSDSSAEQQSDDEDDIFGHMISDNDYFLEVINADSGVILNKISLQRVCISNVLINAPQNSKQTSNDVIRISVDEDEINNELLENNITTTVYYDHNSNPRIEKVIDENKLHVRASDENLVPPPSPTLPNKRQNLIIKELLETEVTFIEGLRIIIEEYMAYFKEHPEGKYSNPPYLRSLFGNVEEIYAKAQEFYADLLTCDFNIEKVATTFLERENLFEVFVEYIKNKPTSQLFSLGFYHSALKERHAQLQEKECLDLESYLLTPIQRLGRYILFMENLQKVTKAMGKVCAVLNEATDFLKREMRRADTFVAAVSIGNSPIDLTKKGSLVAKETFNLKKKDKSVVFLFQDIVVFTTPNQQRAESYFYKDSIEMSDLAIRSDQEQPLTFNLRSFSKSCNYEESPHSFELEAQSEKVKKKWVQEIENLLWEQLEKCKAEALSGETVYRKFTKAASSTNSSSHYKKKKQPEIPSTPSTNNERQSVFYVEVE